MKRIISFFLLVFYTLTSAGVGIQTHQCGKSKTRINVVFNSEHSCVCGKKKMKSNCCKNKIDYLKVKTSHLGSFSSEVKAEISSVFNLAILSLFFFSLENQFKVDFSLCHGPPIYSGPLIYLENQNFLI